MPKPVNSNHGLILFNPNQVLPLQARVNLGAMAMKGCSTFPKAPALLEPQYQIVLYHIQDSHCRGSLSSAEKQSVYSTLPVNWAICDWSSNKILEVIFKDKCSETSFNLILNWILSINNISGSYFMPKGYVWFICKCLIIIIPFHFFFICL